MIWNILHWCWNLVIISIKQTGTHLLQKANIPNFITNRISAYKQNTLDSQKMFNFTESVVLLLAYKPRVRDIVDFEIQPGNIEDYKIYFISYCILNVQKYFIWWNQMRTKIRKDRGRFCICVQTYFIYQKFKWIGFKLSQLWNPFYNILYSIWGGKVSINTPINKFM